MSSISQERATEEPISPENPSSARGLRTTAELEEIVARIAASDQWVDRVRLRADRRWYERIHQTADHDVWIISWLPGQSTGFHDHGGSAGAFAVASGVLQEIRADGACHVAEKGKAFSFGPDYAHDVRNDSTTLAVSIHAYSPPLNEMNEYELDNGYLVLRNSTSQEQEQTIVPDPFTRGAKIGQGVDHSSVSRLLASARSRLHRVSPREAYNAASTSANTVLVDIRPGTQRAEEGTIPGALIVERNVLEWRFDPTSSARLPIANGPDLRVIVFCSEGYASSFAAAGLQDVGLWRATDVVGGFRAWEAEGLPTNLPERL
ncbi:cysteine dioxygenase [Acidobacteria bacterium AB60]|nr:cysteine dioxygenase [Acidobacteria bacterium AB60]